MNDLRNAYLFYKNVIISTITWIIYISEFLV